MPRLFEHLVVIGASAGGVHALLRIAERLPRSFPAPVCIVQHIGAHPSLLPQLLDYRGPNAAIHPEDGQPLAPGTLFVAPPDHHMLVEGEVLRLTHGPKENHVRPAVDPLFRSAAAEFGSRAIGVVLTGQMDDGAVGLKAIKEMGGITVVQDPQTAEEPEMPRSALAAVDADHCVALDAIAPLLARVVGAPPAPTRSEVPERLAREVAINRGEATVENLAAIAEPSPLTCPDCGGGLWEVKEQKPVRYRCNTGHAYSALSLGRAQEEVAEHTVLNAVRALRERQMLLRRLAHVAEAIGDLQQARAGLHQAERLEGQIGTLMQLAQETPREEHDVAS